MTWVNAVVQGVLLGGLYALLACGLSLIFGVMRIINLAHGDLAILFAFVLTFLSDQLGLPPALGLIVVLPLAALFGYLLQRGILSRSLRSSELSPLLATFGLAIVLQNVLLQAFSANTRQIDIGRLGTAGLKVSNQLSIPALGVLTLAVAVLVLGGLQLMLTRTSAGRAIRATASDWETAELMGINARSVYAYATAIAVATAALAGVLFAMRSTFDPFSGQPQLIFAFEAVIIGGLGSLWGTLLGGTLLGVAQTIGAQVDPAYPVLAGHLLFLFVLAFRPAGILAARLRV